jgi:hypothetical protein
MSVTVRVQKSDSAAPAPSSFRAPRKPATLKIHHRAPPFTDAKSLAYHTTVICGPTGSGKTNAIMNLYQQNQGLWSEVILVCGSAASDTDYSFIPKGNKFKWDDNLVEDLIKIQEEKKARAERNGQSSYAGLLLILDDFAGMVKHNDKTLNLLVSQCRHYRISVFVAVQYYKMVSPTIRANAFDTYMVQQSINSVSGFMTDCCSVTKWDADAEAARVEKMWREDRPYAFLFRSRNMIDNKDKYEIIEFPLLKQ